MVKGLERTIGLICCHRADIDSLCNYYSLCESSLSTNVCETAHFLSAWAAARCRCRRRCLWICLNCTFRFRSGRRKRGRRFHRRFRFFPKEILFLSSAPAFFSCSITDVLLILFIIFLKLLCFILEVITRGNKRGVCVLHGNVQQHVPAPNGQTSITMSSVVIPGGGLFFPDFARK